MWSNRQVADVQGSVQLQDVSYKVYELSTLTYHLFKLVVNILNMEQNQNSFGVMFEVQYLLLFFSVSFPPTALKNISLFSSKMLHYIRQLVAHFVCGLVLDMLHIKRAFYNMLLHLSCRFSFPTHHIQSWNWWVVDSYMTSTQVSSVWVLYKKIYLFLT